MRQFTGGTDHAIATDVANKINANYPLKALKEEANYILEGQDEYNGTYNITKKPTSEVATVTTDIWGYIRGKEKVLIIHKEGTFNRYNFDFVSQFPASN